MAIHPNSGARAQVGSTNLSSHQEHIAKHSGRQQYISRENPNQPNIKSRRSDESVSQKLQDVHSGTVEIFQDPRRALREMFQAAAKQPSFSRAVVSSSTVLERSRMDGVKLGNRVGKLIGCDATAPGLPGIVGTSISLAAMSAGRLVATPEALFVGFSEASKGRSSAGMGSGLK